MKGDLLRANHQHEQQQSVGSEAGKIVTEMDSGLNILMYLNTPLNVGQ